MSILEYVESKPTVYVDPKGLQPPKDKPPSIPGIPSTPPDAKWYPPDPTGKEWDMPSPNPNEWFSPLCRDACEEVRKKIGMAIPKEKRQEQTDILGQAWCAKDPKTNLHYACPCLMDIRIASGEEFKWDECPELAWCIYRHEVAHIEGGTFCHNEDLCPGKMPEKIVDDFHDRQFPVDEKCLTRAMGRIAKWPESEKKEKCIRLADDLVSKPF